MLEVRNVSKSYGEGTLRVNVLDDISLVIEESEFLAVIGRSGSGKSTLLNIIGALDRPDSGAIYFRGSSLSDRSADERANYRLRSASFVFQFFNLLPTLTILENVAIPAYLAGTSSSEARARAEACLKLLEIEHLSKRLPDSVSGGELQRAAVARALVNEPAMLLADEPTGNLDSENGRTFLKLIADIRRERSFTVILATHDPEVAGAADRIVRLENGRLSPVDGALPS